MRIFIDTLAAGLRWTMALIFAWHVIPPTISHVLGKSYLPDELEAQTIAVHALLVVTVIWLAFGLRTRVVAVLGGTLFVAHGLLGQDDLSHGAPVMWLIIAVGLIGSALAVVGGGRWCMYRGGWSVPV